MKRTPAPPAHLDDQAAAKWRELLPILEGRGDVDQAVADALAAYAVAWSRWIAAEQQVNALGPVVKSPAGFPVANPYLAVAAAAQRQMRQWATELQLTPKGRSKTGGQNHEQPAGKESAVVKILRAMDADESAA